MENNLMTVFTRIFHTQGDSLVELSAWIENVRNGQWKNEVENYRRLMAEGKKQEAASVKEQLPALVPAGNCLRGRYPKCLTNRTGYAMFDMDKMPPDVLRNAFARLKEIPWVAACHVTVSGTGLRIFVCIGVVHPDVYRRAYEIVAHALEQVAGHPCDMQCKDLCRLTLASYDPEAYLAPEPLTFPYEEGNNPLLYQPATGTDSSEDYRFNGRTAGNSYGDAPRNAGNASGPAPGNTPGYAPVNPADYASGNAGFRPFGIPEDPNDDCRYVPLRDPEAFLANFFRKNKFQEGQRHNVLLRLGRNIRWRRFNPYDFERLKHSAFRMMGQLPYSEYCSAMDWGYNHADLGPWVHMDPNGPSTVRKESDEDDLMSYAPLFPEWIYDKLPPLIRRGIIATRSGRQRDMLLMSILTNLSGCVPLVRTLYAHRLYSPHFFFAAVAPAGSGKGVVALSALLGSKIHREMEENNRRERKEYEQKMLEWGRTETGLPRETQARHQSQARRAPVARAERTAQHLQEPADDRPLQLRRDRNHLQHHRDRLLHRCPGNGLRQACLRTAYDLPPRSRGTELQDRRPPHSHPAPPHGHLHGRYPATAGQLRLIEGRRYVQPSVPAHGKG